MPVILLPDRWRRQPTGPVEIDYGHPLAPTPDGLVMLGGMLLDAVTRSRMSIIGSVPVVPSSFGMAPQFDVGSNVMYQNNAANLPVMSAFVLLEKDGYDNSSPRMMSLNDDQWNFYTANGSGYQYDVGFGAMWSGTHLVWKTQTGLNPIPVGFVGSVGVAYDASSSANDASIYVHGRQLAAPLYSGSRSGSVSSNGGIRAFGNRYGTKTRNLGGRLPLVIMTGELWGDAEFAALNENPWQIFRPRDTLYFFPSATGNAYQESVAESLSLADTAVARLSATVDVAESMILHDVVFGDVLPQSFVESLTESLVLSDGIAIQGAIGAPSLSEWSPLSDAVGSKLTAKRGITEQLTLVDAVSGRAVTSIAVVEQMVLADVVVPRPIFKGRLSESLALAASELGRPSYRAGLTEKLSLLDAPDGAVSAYLGSRGTQVAAGGVIASLTQDDVEAGLVRDDVPVKIERTDG